MSTVRDEFRTAYASAFHDAFSWALVVVLCGPALIAMLRGPRLLSEAGSVQVSSEASEIAEPTGGTRGR